MDRRREDTMDLRHMDSRQILVVSRAQSGMTNAQVAADMGIGEETVARYQREPAPGEYGYELPIGRMRLWCRAVKNDLIIKWAAQQCGGIFAKNSKHATNEDIQQQIVKVSGESHEVVGSLITAMVDGALSKEERADIELHLITLRVIVEEAILAVQGKSLMGKA